MVVSGGEIGKPRTPAELAEIRAEQCLSDSFDQTPKDRRLLMELDYAAEQLGFTDSSYFVESNRALIIPIAFEADKPVAYTSFFGLSFEGRFVTFSTVRIGRVIGGRSVRALCLTFDGATLLPFFDSMDEGDLLHVPVLAVGSMELTE